MKNHKTLTQYNTVVSPQQPNALGGDAQNQYQPSAEETLEMIPISLPPETRIIRGVTVGPHNAHVFAGHGSEPDVEFTLPDGTYLWLPRLRKSKRPNCMRDKDGYYMEIRGKAPKHIKMDKYGPGATAPNLILWPGPDLTLAETSTTVTAPTYLSDLLLPNMGVCIWAACRAKDESNTFYIELKCAA